MAVTGPLSPELQFHILTFINIKVTINPKDTDLILEIIQEGAEFPNSLVCRNRADIGLWFNGCSCLSGH